MIKPKADKDDISKLEFFKASKSDIEKVLDMKIKMNNNLK